MFLNFKHRSYKLERIDTGDYTLSEYETCITELQRVNRFLGDVWALRRTLLQELETSGLSKVSVLDVGAGSGELLRVAADFAKTKNISLHATGLELNPVSAQAILTESPQFPEITAVRGDAFHLPFAEDEFDFVISSLFTHHFTEDQVVVLLREMSRVASRGLYVIDLHRHPVAFLLYTTLGRLVFHSSLLLEDGALSIRRSFKPTELLTLGRRAGLQYCRVERHFPYRLVLKASPPLSNVTAGSRTVHTNANNRAA
jgi:SAM-dependent methyltransferase